MHTTIRTIIVAVLVVSNFSVHAQTAIDDPEFDAALQWAYQSGMTKYNTQNEFMPQGTLTREQGAKMFSVFAMKHLCLAPDESLVCEFTDADTADPTLEPFLKTACQLGLFQGYNGKFMPKSPLTKAQALTVLVRATEGKMDETTTPRWSSYFSYAQNNDLTKETDVNAIDRELTRYESVLIQYRAKSEECTDNTGEYSQELLDILEELFGPQEIPEEDAESDETEEEENDENSDEETNESATGSTSTGDTQTSTGSTTTGDSETTTGDTIGTGDTTTTGGTAGTGDTTGTGDESSTGSEGSGS